MSAPIGVLVVDDSQSVRELIARIVSGQSDMRVVGTAPDPIAAREMVRDLSPDVITLDIEMPRMNGIEFLSRLMRLKPTPVVMVSSLTESGADATLRALELGAVDFVTKPRLDGPAALRDYSSIIIDKIRGAAKARLSNGVPVASAAKTSIALASAPRDTLIAVGASTGGTEALRLMLAQFPENAPGTVVTQHMPAGFTKRFAERLDSQCRVRVHEAQGGEPIASGHVYIAPGDRHLVVKRAQGRYVTALVDSEPVNRHRPSVDVLFDSVAQVAGARAVGVMLTGMGRDGANGMLAMKRAGAFNYAQDEASCVVFGMPREAIAAGGVDDVAPLDAIAARLFARLQTQQRARATPSSGETE